MDTQNCIICQSPAVPGHDFDVNGPLFMNFTKILKSSSTSCSNFDLNEFKSLTLNGHYKKICSTCHHQLTQFDTLTCQLYDLQLKINEICTVIKKKAVQSQLFRKGNFLEDNKTTFYTGTEVDDDDGSINDDIKPDFDFDVIEDHDVNKKDTKVIFESTSSTSTLNSPSTAICDLGLKSKGLKKFKICLEPIQLPSTIGPYDIKNLKIANFIQRDREKIRKYKKRIRDKKYTERKRKARGFTRKRKVQDIRYTQPKICQTCSKSFYCKINYEDHVRKHTGERPFICEFCAKTFRNESFLKKHLERVHSNGQQNKIKCPEPKCGAFCKSQTRLDKHILDIHQNGGLQQEYLCEQCPRSYSELNKLNNHINFEHGEAYKCSYPNCGKKLATKDSLNRHIQSVHEKVAKFFCPECNKGFLKNQCMLRHRKAQHLGESSYDFACDYDQCTRRFLVRNSLEIHKLAAHSTEKPFKCSICSKGFVKAKSLEDHEILHTGTRDFICTYENCTQAYALKYLLNEHIKKHHKYPDKWLTKNVKNRNGFRRRVNRVQIIKNVNEPNQNQVLNK